MALKFFNTLSRGIEEFAPLEPKKVGMYCCGPTIQVGKGGMVAYLLLKRGHNVATVFA